jgi:O-acetyl-ADP-ribose deacetylase (regulator of RNase III)
MQIHTGDILSVTSGIIVQQVNAQGVMASGVAKAIRDKYPIVFDEYSKYVGPAYQQKDNGRGVLGDIIVSAPTDDLLIVSIIGQQFFGRDGKRYTSYDALDVGFKEIATMIAELDLDVEADVHHPLIGAGLGGGDWSIIEAIIKAHLPDTHLWVL